MIARDLSLPFTYLFVDGEQVPASDEKHYDVRNPYTRNIVGRAASANSNDCRQAVESCGKAFQSWQHSTLEQRRNILLKAADLIGTDRYTQKIAAAIREESAAPEHTLFLNTFLAMEFLRQAAIAVEQLKGEIFPSFMPGGQVIAQRRPKGVVYVIILCITCLMLNLCFIRFAIGPWNVPVSLSIRAIAIPIVCGNTVLLKSSEVTPRSQALVAELLYEVILVCQKLMARECSCILLKAGLPAGVCNYISMDKDDVPRLTREIIAHPLVKCMNVSTLSRHVSSEVHIQLVRSLPVATPSVGSWQQKRLNT